ncbi:MAG TPA: SurA N-terminal domain-containing protein [Acidobacteriota bacterium]|jgi:parvulin-like peptidyl-prolyl isomerase|nr:SurA N-terminal domain-containing protein [Acidobacteriota bacterium]
MSGGFRVSAFWLPSFVLVAVQVLLGVIGSLGCGFFAAALADTKIIEEIVAKVNGDVITLTDLQKELHSIREQLGSQYKDQATLDKEYARVSKQALKNLVENKLMLQKAEEAGLAANIDVDVAATIEGIRKENNIPDMKAFEQALQQQGATLYEFRDNLRKRLLMDRLIGRFVQSRITVLDSEITQYYQKNRDKFTKPAEIDISEIVILFEGKQPAETRAKAGQALAELKAGKDFVEVTKKYSEGATAAKGGGVGAFKKGMLAPALESAAFTLKPGENTGILETSYGLVILKLNKKIEAAPVPVDQIRGEIQRQIYFEKMQPELTKFAEQLRLQSYIYVSPKYKDQYPLQ